MIKLFVAQLSTVVSFVILCETFGSSIPWSSRRNSLLSSRRRFPWARFWMVLHQASFLPRQARSRTCCAKHHYVNVPTCWLQDTRSCPAASWVVLHSTSADEGATDTTSPADVSDNGYTVFPVNFWLKLTLKSKYFTGNIMLAVEVRKIGRNAFFWTRRNQCWLSQRRSWN